MTPLEKAKAAEGRVNYCDECESFGILNDAPYCKVDGKLIHPIMLVRGQGTGPAWNCKKRIKPITNYERLIRKTPEEMAEFLWDVWRHKDPFYKECVDGWPVPFYHWLKTEVES